MISIICVDDDRGILDAYRGLLTNRGYHLRTFDSGDNLLSSLREQVADLLILDLHMPGKSGIELCTEIRNSPEAYSIPIIIVSGDDTEDKIVSGLSAGADDYITKPFRPTELFAKITSVIKKRNDNRDEDIPITLGSLFAGQYEIIGKLGRGGFSKVYYARDVIQSPQLEVALKVFELPNSSLDQHEFMSLFLREAYALSKLDHPKITKLLNFGHTNSYSFLAMEYLEGTNFRQIVEESGVLSEWNATLVGLSIASALQYLESNNLVHRDIKPANIICDKSGEVKLVDFGLARNINEETLSSNEHFKGTPQFAAPECISLESEIDIKADIFSLGATLFYLTTSVNPFSGTTPMEVYDNRQFETPKSLRKVKTNLGATFGSLVDQMLVENKEGRPEIDQVIAILNSLVSSKSQNH